MVGDDISIPCCEPHPAKVLDGFPFLLLFQVRYFGIILGMYVAVNLSFGWYIVC